MSFPRFALQTLSLALFVALATPAIAEIEEIVVTAQKREESLQDVPISIQSLTGEDLQKLGVNRADDILNQFPNLSSNAANEVNSGYTIRGVGTNNFHGNVNRAVGVYQDDVSIATPYSGVLGVYDLQRVEILRGPQNTLFGRNTTGGAINYITVAPKPGEEVNGYVRVTGGTESLFEVGGALGFPLGEQAAARISFQNQDRDGLFINQSPGREGEKLGERDRFGARVQLAWEPSDDTRVLLNWHVGENGGKNAGNKVIGTQDPDEITVVDVRGTDYDRHFDPCPLDDITRGLDFETVIPCFDGEGENPSLDSWEKIYNPTAAKQDVDIDGGFIKIEHNFSGYEFTSITAYEETTVQFDENNYSSPTRIIFNPSQDSAFEQFSQEIRVASTADGTFRWIAGLYYFKEDMDQATAVRRFRFDNNAQILAFNILEQEDEDLSIYAQGELDISERLTLTIGARYTDNTKEADSLFGIIATPASVVPESQFITKQFLLDTLYRRGTANEGIPTSNCPPGMGNPLPCWLYYSDALYDPAAPDRSVAPPGTQSPTNYNNPGLSLSNEEVGGKISLDYQVNDDVLLYGNYSRGFKSGGFDTRALAALSERGADTPVEPEFLDAFEFGVKSLLAQNTLQLNTAVFHYIWEDLQNFTVLEGLPGFYNVPEAELTGLEVEIKWSPTENTLAQLGIGYLDTEITDNGGFVGFDIGHELIQSPEWTFNGLIRHEIVPAGGALRSSDGLPMDG